MPPQFPSTKWSLIRASAIDEPHRRRAFEELATEYRRAILAFFRARLGSQEADDATQEFLTISYERAWWSRADAMAGSFRGFLLLLLRRHLGRLRQSAMTGCVPDASEIDHLVDAAAPMDLQFDRRFALVLTARALDQLRLDYQRRDRGALVERLLPLLSSAPEYGELKIAAHELGLAPNTLSVELKRLRSRLQARLRDELRELCLDEVSFEAEWKFLRQILGPVS